MLLSESPVEPPPGFHGDTGIASKYALVSRGYQNTFMNDEEGHNPVEPTFEPFTPGIPYFTSSPVFANGKRFFNATVQYVLQTKSFADLLYGVIFSCDVPYSPYACYRDMGNRIFKEMSISVLGREIQKISGEFSSMNALMASTDYQKANITGEMTNLSNHADETPEAVNFTKVSVPVPFFFNLYKSGQPLPISALFKDNITITWTFQENSLLYLVVPMTPTDDGTDYEVVDLELKQQPNFFGDYLVEEADRLFVFKSSWNYANSIRVCGLLLTLDNYVGIGKPYPGVRNQEMNKPYENLYPESQYEPYRTRDDDGNLIQPLTVKHVTTNTFVLDNTYDAHYNDSSRINIDEKFANYWKFYGATNPDLPPTRTSRTEEDVQSRGWFKIHSTGRVGIGVPWYIQQLSDNGRENLMEIDIKRAKLIFKNVRLSKNEAIYMRSEAREYVTENCFGEKYVLDLENPYHTLYLNSTVRSKALYWYFDEIPEDGVYAVEKCNEVFTGGRIAMNNGIQRLDEQGTDFFSYYMAACDRSNNLFQHFSFAFVHLSRGREVFGKLFQPPRKDTSALKFSTQQTPLGCKRLSLTTGYLKSNMHFLLLPYSNIYQDESMVHAISTQMLGTWRLPNLENPNGTRWPWSGIGIGKRYILGSGTSIYENDYRIANGLPEYPENPYYDATQIWYTTSDWNKFSTGDPRLHITDISHHLHISSPAEDHLNITLQADHIERSGWVTIPSTGRVSVSTDVKITKKCNIRLVYVTPRKITLKDGAFQEIAYY